MTKFVHVVYSLLSKNRSETAEHGRGGGGGDVPPIFLKL